MVTPRSVVGIEVTPTAVCLAKVREGDPLPKTGVVEILGDHGGSHTVAATVNRMLTVTTDVMNVIAGSQPPTLVAMAKLSWNTMQKDPGAHRRAGLWFTIATECYRAQIPVAELPLLTVEAWAGAEAKLGMVGIESLIAKVTEVYPNLPPKKGFRPTCVAVAAAVAMALPGFETAWEVSQERLNRLCGYRSPDSTERVNRGIQWPGNHRPPRTLAEWYAEESEQETA